ncbi:MAG: helix-turn-helix domain-containing protein [Gammaproteobacteria bacterium]|nr:helix-turn-helix domain-containing protein [Gammaproteobacteria bacterium]
MARPTGNRGIARYTLYGEEISANDPEFVHIEPIVDRSRLHDWRIRPHSHQRMFQLVFIATGVAEVSVDDSSRCVTGPCAVTLPASVVHAFRFEPEIRGYVVTVAELLLTDARYRRSRALLEPLFRQAQVTRFFTDDPESAFVERSLAQMLYEYQRQRPGRDAMFEWLLRIVLTAIRRRMGTQTGVEEDRQGDPGTRFARFRQLVDEHYRNHWSVEQYADALAISQGRLNRLCQLQERKSAGEIVQDRMVLEAQRHLIYSTASVALIAYDLGFNDPAYFSRFFKRRTGVTPGAFRRRRERR